MISGETYFLHPTNEWAYSSSSMQVIDNCVDTQIRLRQPLGALREVSYQLFAGDQILASAFEERPDMLCVPRQLVELLKVSLEDILQDFDAICTGDWRQRGVSPAEIRTFCVWRNAPMFFVDCRGRLLDCFQPMQKEEKGHSLHRLERTRFLLQKRPGRGGVRRSGATSLPSAAAGLQHSRILGVEALRRGDRVWPLLERKPAKRAGPAARSGAPAQGGTPRTLRVVRPAPASVGSRLRDSRALRGCTGAAGVDAAPGRALPRAAAGRGEP